MCFVIFILCHSVKCCFKTIVKPFIYIDIDYGLLRLPNVDYWLTAGVTGQHGMLTHPRHLIPPLVYPGDRVCYGVIFVLFLEYEIDNGSLSLPFHVAQTYFMGRWLIC